LMAKFIVRATNTAEAWDVAENVWKAKFPEFTCPFHRVCKVALLHKSMAPAIKKGYPYGGVILEDERVMYFREEAGPHQFRLIPKGKMSATQLAMASRIGGV